DHATGAERVLISYTHDSPEHSARVEKLAARLRGDGVEATIDRYHPNPPEGWPQWMRRQIREATHVVVVCTETYRRRADLLEEPGLGLGGTLEAVLSANEVYNAQMRNTKFIPVIFSSADATHIPDYLQGATRYDLSRDGEYDALYAYLTGRQLVPVPPLGPRREIGYPQYGHAAGVSALSAAAPAPAQAAAPPDDLVLLESDQRRRFLFAERIAEQADHVEITLAPRGAEEVAFLSGLKGRWPAARLWFAYGDTAGEATVDTAERERQGGRERWTLRLVPSDANRGNSMEVGTTGKSADDIAELRARRVLLDERPPAEVQRWGRVDNTLERFVQGLGSGHALGNSPLPALYHEMPGDPAVFLAAARLVGILWLIRTGTVEHVLDLELRLATPDSLHVRFRGRRRKIYTNMPAHEIAFEGVCALRAGGAP
ncbi:MAG TPA: SEFIR domain-containing protein, partial [Longimicrobium sp.]|nr:SEFIR domain-containing protein [Longimicrobium sp.]